MAEDLIEFVGRLERYRDLLVKQNLEREFDSRYLFDDLMQMMPDGYITDYLKWQMVHPEQIQCAKTLIVWCQRQLKLIQDREIRLRKKTGSIAWKNTPEVTWKPDPEVITLNHGRQVRQEKKQAARSDPNVEPLGSSRGRSHLGKDKPRESRDPCPCCKTGTHELHACKQFSALSPPKSREFY